jgi:hypothetical protein
MYISHAQAKTKKAERNKRTRDTRHAIDQLLYRAVARANTLRSE